MNKERKLLSIVEIKPLFVNLIWLGIYKALLDVVYTNLLATRWAYVGFSKTAYTTSGYAVSWMILFLTAVCLTQLMKCPSFSSVIMQCLLIFSFIPGIVMYTYREQSIMSIYMVYWVCLVAFYFAIGTKKRRTMKFGVSEKTLTTLSIIIFLLCFYIWARYAHFHLQLDLFEVYDQRALAYNFNMSTIFKYLFGSAQVCIPFLAVWALNHRNKTIFWICIASQVIAFFSQGSKASFFALFTGILAHYVVQQKDRYSTIIIPIAMSISAMICLLERYALHSHFLVDYIFRRILFLPNLLNIYYHDFFSRNEYDYFRSSILRFLGFKSPYADAKIQMIIGSTYFNSSGMYTNNGLFSDAYMNLGVFGLVIMPLLIVLLLCFFDKCIGDAKPDILIGSAVYIVICLIGSSFFTNLFTHGFIMIALLFCFLDKENAVVIKLGK